MQSVGYALGLDFKNRFLCLHVLDRLSGKLSDHNVGGAARRKRYSGVVALLLKNVVELSVVNCDSCCCRSTSSLSGGLTRIPLLSVYFDDSIVLRCARRARRVVDWSRCCRSSCLTV